MAPTILANCDSSAGKNPERHRGLSQQPARGFWPRCWCGPSASGPALLASVVRSRAPERLGRFAQHRGPIPHHARRYTRAGPYPEPVYRVRRSLDPFLSSKPWPAATPLTIRTSFRTRRLALHCAAFSVVPRHTRNRDSRRSSVAPRFFIRRIGRSSRSAVWRSASCRANTALKSQASSGFRKKGPEEAPAGDDPVGRGRFIEMRTPIPGGCGSWELRLTLAQAA